MSNRSKLIRQAFETSLDVLGAPTKQALIEDLERYGIYMNDPQFNLPQLEQGLKQRMGDEATGLILERVNRKLDELERSRRETK